MVGTLFSSLASTGVAAYNTFRAHQEAENEQDVLNAQKSSNESYLNRYMNADATQLADNRAFITENAQNLRRNNQAAAGRTAVMGGTNAQAASVKEANNIAAANTNAKIAANNQQYRTHVQDAYRRQDDVLAQRQRALDQRRVEANAKAGEIAVKALGDIAPEADKWYDDYRAKNQAKKEEVLKQDPETKHWEQV